MPLATRMRFATGYKRIASRPEIPRSGSRPLPAHRPALPGMRRQDPRYCAMSSRAAWRTFAFDASTLPGPPPGGARAPATLRPPGAATSSGATSTGPRAARARRSRPARGRHGPRARCAACTHRCNAGAWARRPPSVSTRAASPVSEAGASTPGFSFSCSTNHGPCSPSDLPGVFHRLLNSLPAPLPPGGLPPPGTAALATSALVGRSRGRLRLPDYRRPACTLISGEVPVSPTLAQKVGLLARSVQGEARPGRRAEAAGVVRLLPKAAGDRDAHATPSTCAGSPGTAPWNGPGR